MCLRIRGVYFRLQIDGPSIGHTILHKADFLQSRLEFSLNGRESHVDVVAPT